jgi:hypothetical protein
VPLRLAMLLALAMTFASSEARAIPGTVLHCGAWKAFEPVDPAFTRDVPLEGFVIVPVAIYGEEKLVGDVELDVRDERGEPVAGEQVPLPVLIGDYGELQQPYIAWQASAPLVPGATYTLHATSANALDECGNGPLDLELAFTVATASLDERLTAALDGVGALSFAWTRDVGPAWCCHARSLEACGEADDCWACMDSLVRLDVVLARAPAPTTPYLSYSLHGTTSLGGEIEAGAAFPAADDHPRLRMRVCAERYCVSLKVTSVMNGESVQSEVMCLDAAAPSVSPSPHGVPLYLGDPCEDGSGQGTFTRSEPPECWQYAEPVWFPTESEGREAFGLPTPTPTVPLPTTPVPTATANDPAPRATPSSVGHDGCSLTGARDGSSVGALLVALVLLARGARRRVGRA